MLYASTEEKETWLSGIQKQLVLTFSDGTVLTNEDIAAESLTFEQSICEEEALRFGQTSSSCLSVTVMTGARRYKGLQVTAQITAGDYTRRIGTFTVVSDKAGADRITRELVCYDALYSVLKTDYSAWHNGLRFPMTLKQYRDAFFRHIGITQETITLPNDGMEIEKNFVADNFSGSDLLFSICEINATFGHIGFDGKFRYVTFTRSANALYPDTDRWPSVRLYPKDWVTERLGGGAGSRATYIQGTLEYEEFQTKTVTQVQVRQTQDDIGVVIGSPGNTYIVQDNPLLYGKGTDQLTEAANNFFAVARYVTYRPSRVQTRAMPWVEMGDSIGVTTRTGEDIVMFVLRRRVNGITALIDEYEATGLEYYTENANGTNRSLLVLKQRTNELYRSVEETRSTLTAVDTKLNGEITTRKSEIKQTADAISAEVTRASRAEGNLSSRITQTADAIQTKVTKGNVSSEITQESGQISIKSNRLIIESDNFELTKTGTIKCKSGTIGDFTIGSCLYYGQKSAWGRASYDGFYIGKEGLALGAGVGGYHGFAISPDGYAYCDRMYYTDSTGHKTKYSWHCDWPYHNTLAIATGGPIDVNQEGDGITKIHNTSIIDSYEGAVSDRRLKKNIQQLPSGESLALLMKLKPVYYEYNDEKQAQSRFNEGLRHGFIAQDVLEALGEEANRTAIVFSQDDGFYSLRYDEFVADAVNVIQLHEERLRQIESLHEGDGK